MEESNNMIDELEETASKEYKGFNIITTDPHGFYLIKQKTGPLPGKLEGMFTSTKEAEKAVEAYVNLKEYVASKETIAQKQFRKTQEKIDKIDQVKKV